MVIPNNIDGTEVSRDSDYEPVALRGGFWITLRPVDENDSRLWEFDTKSGRIIRTI